MTVNVDFVVNDKSKGNVDLSQLVSVEIRGATGCASYRVDPLQDVVIKIVVVGVPANSKGDDIPVEQELGTIGTADNVKALAEAKSKALHPSTTEKVSK